MITADPDTATGPAEGNQLQTWTDRPSVRQFVKFCIVGATSTAIDYAVFGLVLDGLQLRKWLQTWLGASPGWQHWADEHQIAILLAATLSFLVSVTNGFIWNRRWTFAHARGRSPRRQYVQFALVNIVGLTLNLTIIRATVPLWAPVVGRRAAPYAAKMIATGVVVFWNFLANKYWTFAK
jgi:putative flippase GtrA